MLIPFNVFYWIYLNGRVGDSNQMHLVSMCKQAVPPPLLLSLSLPPSLPLTSFSLCLLVVFFSLGRIANPSKSSIVFFFQHLLLTCCDNKFSQMCKDRVSFTQMQSNNYCLSKKTIEMSSFVTIERKEKNVVCYSHPIIIDPNKNK